MGKLFCWAVAQDRLSFPQSPLFDDKGLCRISQFQFQDLCSIARRAAMFFELGLVRVRNREAYGRHVFATFREIKLELMGQDGKEPARHNLLRLLKKIDSATQHGRVL